MSNKKSDSGHGAGGPGSSGPRRVSNARKLLLAGIAGVGVLAVLFIVQTPLAGQYTDTGIGVPPAKPTSTGTAPFAVQYTDTWIPQSRDAVQDEYMMSTTPASAPAADSLGFAVGGSQDIGNFRENVENGFLPIPTDITYEGLFYDYYFDTGSMQECEKLFCPSYSYAVSRNPFSDGDEYYLSVGLNSGIRESDFERKKLNLVLVLDVSGSMSSSFDRYYYDRYGLELEPHDDFTVSKLSVARESIVGLLDHLTDEDNLGVVLFDNDAHLARPLVSMGITDRELLKQNVLEIHADGGTNMASGIRAGTSLFDGVAGEDESEYENRIIFLTDAMPNTGEIGKDGLLGMMERNAGRGIHTTVIGIGVDFNTELVDHIAGVPGANYYSVHSSSDFRERMVDEFEFMVTPLVFDLSLDVDAAGYEIKDVYGSPEADRSTGQIMRVGTLFPSKVTDGQTRGGIVLLKLEKLSDNGAITLTASYRDRAGQQDHDMVTVLLEDKEPDFYQNGGIRKGILLARYAELMRAWAYDERRALADGTEPATSHLYGDETSPPGHTLEPLGEWERQSIPLAVSGQYADAISQFGAYFQEEAGRIGDPGLLREVSLMQKLAGP